MVLRRIARAAIQGNKPGLFEQMLAELAKSRSPEAREAIEGLLEPALESQEPNYLARLLENGLSANGEPGRQSSPLTQAVDAGKVQAIRFLAGKGANLEFRSFRQVVVPKATTETNDGLQMSNLEPDLGLTPLMTAVVRGNVDIVRELLALKADLGARSNKGRSALHFACSRALFMNQGGASEPPTLQNRLAIVSLLVGAGAELNAKDADGSTPLSVAVASRFVDVANNLRQAGAQ